MIKSCVFGTPLDFKGQIEIKECVTPAFLSQRRLLWLSPFQEGDTKPERSHDQILGSKL